jgi:zinc-ribbon family
MLIWGTRWVTVVLGQFIRQCSNCPGSAQSGVVRKGKFTLFFIPIFPIGKDYLLVCNVCGLRLRAVGSLLEELKQMDQPQACKNCGSALPAAVKFCSACGTQAA